MYCYNAPLFAPIQQPLRTFADRTHPWRGHIDFDDIPITLRERNDTDQTMRFLIAIGRHIAEQNRWRDSTDAGDVIPPFWSRTSLDVGRLFVVWLHHFAVHWVHQIFHAGALFTRRWIFVMQQFVWAHQSPYCRTEENRTGKCAKTTIISRTHRSHCARPAQQRYPIDEWWRVPARLHQTFDVGNLCVFLEISLLFESVAGVGERSAIGAFG